MNEEERPEEKPKVMDQTPDENIINFQLFYRESQKVIEFRNETRTENC